MSEEEEVLAIATKYRESGAPFTLEDAEKIIHYCFKVREEKGCNGYILRQRFGRGK